MPDKAQVHSPRPTAKRKAKAPYKRKPRFSQGCKPTPDSNFVLCATFLVDKMYWDVYKDDVTSEYWCNYKVISLKRIRQKANYYIAYSKQENRIGGSDFVAMAQHMPDLLQSFMSSVGLNGVEYFGYTRSKSIEEMLKAVSEVAVA